MAKVKGLLFDFNGTLFFDSEFHIEAFRRCFEKYGIPPLDRQQAVNRMFGRTNEQIFKTCFFADATDEDIAKFEQQKEAAYMELCKENPEDFHLCTGVPQMLDFLKLHSIPFCIATGSPRVNVEFYFEYLGLDRWFTLDNLVYIDGTFPGKPAPDIYQRAAARIGLDASECAVFEDATSGIRAARAAGACSVVAVWESSLPSPITEDARADAVYHDFSQWRRMLSDIGAV